MTPRTLDPFTKAEWMNRAACAGKKTALTSSNPEMRKQAINDLCSRCPVFADCAQYAIDNDEAYFVWGGLDVGTLGRSRRHAALAARAAGQPVSLVKVRKPRPVKKTARQEWTPARDCVARTGTAKEAAAALGISVSAVHRRRKALGMSGPGAVEWTPPMDDVIRRETVRDAAAMLDVSTASVVRRRREIGAQSGPPKRQWTPGEDRIILTAPTIIAAAQQVSADRAVVAARRRELLAQGVAA